MLYFILAGVTWIRRVALFRLWVKLASCIQSRSTDGMPLVSSVQEPSLSICCTNTWGNSWLRLALPLAIQPAGVKVSSSGVQSGYSQSSACPLTWVLPTASQLSFCLCNLKIRRYHLFLKHPVALQGWLGKNMLMGVRLSQKAIRASLISLKRTSKYEGGIVGKKKDFRLKERGQGRVMRAKNDSHSIHTFRKSLSCLAVNLVNCKTNLPGSIYAHMCNNQLLSDWFQGQLHRRESMTVTVSLINNNREVICPMRELTTVI